MATKKTKLGYPIAKISDGKFKPLKGMIIVEVDLEEKNEYIMEGTGTKLFIDKSFGWNEREKNATNAKVLHGGKTGLKEGDQIVCWHNSFKDVFLLDTREIDEQSMFGSGNKKIYTYAIRIEWVYFVLDEEGNQTPMDGYVIVDRIYKMPETTSSLIFLETSEEKEKNRAVIRKVPKSWELPFGWDDVIIIETMADYEVVYSFKGKEQRCIRVKDMDIIAIDHSFDIKQPNLRLGI